MYYNIFAERDATIYEKYPEQNTGIDQILELTKIASGSIFDGFYQSNTYNSRILIDFGSQISEISNSIDQGEIPTISEGTRFYLNLRATNAESLPISYSLMAYPVSESWVNGTGNFDDVPIAKNGVSWRYRDGSAGDASPLTSTFWNTASAQGQNTGQTEIKGGGTYITASHASQAFNYESPDIRMDVTDIVNLWFTGSSDRMTNNGIIIKRPDSDENSGVTYGTLQFFSKDTHTIYVPKLEVAWDDSDDSGTSLYEELTDDNVILYFKNLRQEYIENSKTKLRLAGRKMFPDKTYSTASFYAAIKRLPTSSYYSVKDAVTEETIIPFDTTASRISCDSKGNYFNIRLNSFLPERTYKFVIKTINDGGDNTRYHDNGYYFRVVR